MEESVIRIVVYGFLLNEDKKFLIVQRANHDTNPGIWEMPGGTLEIGEEPIEGVIREIREETNLEVQIKRPLTVKSIYKRSSQTKKMTHTIRIAFQGQIVDGSKKIALSNEHAAFKWVDVASLPQEMVSDFLKYTIEQMKKEDLL